MNWSYLIVPDVSIAEKIVRAAMIYGFLLIILRVMGKREVGQLTPFDLVVLLIISNAVQNAIIGPDNSLAGGIVSVVTIIALNVILVRVAYSSKKVRRFLEGNPTVLVHNGRVIEDHMRRELVTREELMAALRKAGLSEPSEVRYAILEENGQISVIPRKADRPGGEKGVPS